MKCKTLLIASAIIAVTFSACEKKDYTCVCTIINSQTTNKETVKALSESTAKTECSKLSTATKTCLLESESKTSSSHHDDDLFD